MHALVAAVLFRDVPGLMRSIPIPRRNHHTESLERPKKSSALAKGTPLSVRIASGSRSP